MQGNQYQKLLDSELEEAQQIRAIKQGWNDVARGKNLRLFSIKYKDNDIKLGKIEGAIPANFEKAGKYYSECFESQKKCRDICDELKCLEVIDANTSVLVFRTKSKFIVSSRDVVSVQ